MKTKRMSVKSPLSLAREALEAARDELPAYSSRYSRRDYTLHQLAALVKLREYLGTDYRGLEMMLREWAELREILGLDRVPDHTTIQRAERRLKAPKRRRARPKPGQRAAAAEVQPEPAPASSLEASAMAGPEAAAFRGEFSAGDLLGLSAPDLGGYSSV